MKYRKFSWGGLQSGYIPGVLPAQQTQFIPSGQGTQAYSPDLKNFYKPEEPEKLKQAGLDGDLLKSIMGKGHTNAGNYVIGQAEQAVKQLNQAVSQYGNEFLKTEAGKKLANAAVIDYSVINKLERDLKNTENYQKVTEANDAGSVTAISDKGTVVAKDTQGNVKELKIADYLANKGSYKLLNNSEVYTEKDTNPNLTFSDVGSYTTNTWGSVKVTDYMNKFMSNWGLNANKEEREMIDDLKKLGNPDSAIGWINSKGGNENNKQQMLAALQSFKAQLPIHVRNTLYANSLDKANTPKEVEDNYNKGILEFFYKGYTNKTESSVTGKSDKSLMDLNMGAGDYKKSVDTSEWADKMLTSQLFEDHKTLNFKTGKYNVNIQGIPLPPRNQQDMVYTDKKNVYRNAASSNADKIYTASGKLIPKDVLNTMILTGDSAITVLPIDKATGQPIPLDQYQKRYGTKLSGADLMKMYQQGNAKKFVAHEGNFNYNQEHIGIEPDDENLKALYKAGDIELFDKSTEEGKKIIQLIDNAVQNSYNPNKDKEFVSPYKDRDTAARTTVLIPVDVKEADILELAQDMDAQKSGINNPEQFNAASTYIGKTQSSYKDFFGINGTK
jgi:hypothetical protein